MVDKRGKRTKEYLAVAGCPWRTSNYWLAVHDRIKENGERSVKRGVN